MPERVKLRYEISAASAAAPDGIEGVVVRRITPTDRDALSHLILDAYRGTIDYEGETLAEAAVEIGSWLDDPTSRLDCSLCAESDGSIVAGVLVSDWDDTQLIGIVMTAAAYKQRGLGRLVTQSALEALSAAGSDRVALYITEGNTASEKLFASLGATKVEDLTS